MQPEWGYGDWAPARTKGGRIMTEQLTESETKDTTVVVNREVSYPLK